MRNFFGLLIIAFACLNTAFAQTPGININKKFGGSNEDVFRSLAQLSNGNYILAGHTNSADYQCVGNHGDNDFFLTCTSAQGQLLWQKLIGGSDNDGDIFGTNQEAVAATADGGFYFTGGTYSTDGDISTNHGFVDVFVAKCDANGNITWKKTFGGSHADYPCGLEYTADGGCLVLASSASDNDGDVPAAHGTQANDAWLFKLDALGNIQWSKIYGGSADDEPTCLLKTANGYMLAMNTTSSDGDLAGSMFSGVSGGADIWIAKIDTTGNIIWKERFGGSQDDNDARICEDADGYLSISCSSRSSDGDFATNTGLYDMAVIRTDSNGTVQWKKIIGGTAWDSNDDIAVTADGNLQVLGLTYSSVINGMQIDYKGQSDIVLYKLNKYTGALSSITTISGTNYEFGRKLLVNKNNQTLIVGEASSTDYDFGYPGFGGEDAFFINMASLNAISGIVYYDFNANGVQDADEPAVENAQVVTSKTNAYSVSTYTYNGNYDNEVDSGTFITKPRLFKSEYFTVKPDSLISVFPGYYQTVAQNFALTPQPDKQDLVIHIVPTSAARYAGTCTYYVVCYNAGTDTVNNGSVSFNKDSKLSFKSFGPTPSSVNGSTCTWNFSQLKPFDTLVYKVSLSVPLAPKVHLGDIVENLATANPINNDLVPDDNTNLSVQFITGSYDPNDKEESHGNTLKPEQVKSGEYLNYTIRFQNTGTDTAFKVVVADTLDNKLDWSSFQMVASSNNYSLKILNGNIVSWTFNNILLPDSNTNEEASHGFISFMIKPLKSLSTGNIIKNKASIYFDYNEPVATKTVETLITEGVLAVNTNGFTVTKQNTGNVLSWIILNMLNKKEFEVQKSRDAINFNTIATIKADVSRTTYSYKDQHPSAGINYYKILIKDIDGTSTYSDIKSVTNSSNFNVTAYPNPARNILYFKADGLNADIINAEVYSTDGRLLNKRLISIDNNRRFSLNVANLPSGMYVIVLKNGDNSTSLRFNHIP